MPDAPRNIPVPDALAAVRAQLKELEAQEAELKQTILADPSARTGKNFAAEVQEVTTARTDLRELRAAYPAEVDEHTYQMKTTRVVLREISEDGELLPFRRKTRA